jgi:hypothetical protein
MAPQGSFLEEATVLSGEARTEGEPGRGRGEGGLSTTQQEPFSKQNPQPFQQSYKTCMLAIPILQGRKLRPRGRVRARTRTQG